MKRLLITLLLLGAVDNVSAMQRGVPVTAGTQTSSLVETAKPVLTGVAGYFTIAGLLKLGALAIAHPIAATAIGGTALVYALSKAGQKTAATVRPEATPRKSSKQMIDFLAALRRSPELRKRFYDMITADMRRERPVVDARVDDEPVDEEKLDADDEYDYYDYVPERRMFRRVKRRPRRIKVRRKARTDEARRDTE